MRASWRRSGETTGIRHRPAHYKACTLFSQRRFQQLLEQCFASGSPSRVYTIVIGALALGVYGEADLVDPALAAGHCRCVGDLFWAPDTPFTLVSCSVC